MHVRVEDLSVDPGMVILNPGDETYESAPILALVSRFGKRKKPPIEETGFAPVIIVVNRRARHKKVRQKTVSEVCRESPR